MVLSPRYLFSIILRTYSGVIPTPASVVAPECTHCQICDREISAVAASSMRLLIAAAPLPLARILSASFFGSGTASQLPSSAAVVSSDGRGGQSLRRQLARRYLEEKYARELAALPAVGKVFGVASQFKAIGNFKGESRFTRREIAGQILGRMSLCPN